MQRDSNAMDASESDSILKQLLQKEDSSNLNKNETGSLFRKLSVMSDFNKKQYRIHDYYSRKYQLFVDDIKKGLNNYADIIMQENQSTQNYSKSWTSQLTPERFISTINKLSSDLSDENQENVELKLEISINNSLKQKMLSTLQETENNNRNSQSTGQPLSSLPVSQRDPPVDISSHKSCVKPVPKQITSNSNDCPVASSSNPFVSAFTSQMGPNMVPKQQPKPLVLTKKSGLPNKRLPEESVDQKSQEVCPFKTAKEQLILNKAKTDSSSVTSVHQYGVSKRSLGTRRGLRSSFVPPIASGQEETDEEDRSPLNPCSLIKNKAASQSSGNSRLDELMLDDRLKSFEPKIVEVIINEIMDNGPKVSWNDIAGLEFVKNTIKEIVIFPMLRPDLFTGLRGPPKGLLLFGPPGTGKTLIGKCVAAQSKSTFFSISASSLTSKWVGEGEKLARALFVVARIHQPAVIFIDEIDSLLSQRSEQEHESSRRIKTEFLIQLDGVSCEENERLLLIGATNRPQEIDEAARRRFVKRLYIPLPTNEARRQIVERLISQHSHHLLEEDVDHIVVKAEGYSGADVTNLCREAAMGPIRNISFETLQNITKEDVRGIELRDFEDAFGQVRASVSKNDLEQYVQWNSQFGSYQITNL